MAECDSTQIFFRYRYFFPGPIFSGTGTIQKGAKFPGSGCHTLPWADICLCTLGRSPTLVQSVKNHWSKCNYEEPYVHPQWREVTQMHIAQSVKSSQGVGDLRAHLFIRTGEKPIKLADPNEEHALRHKKREEWDEELLSFLPLYAHQDFHMRIDANGSAHAHHSHEPQGSATTWTSLYHSHLPHCDTAV